MSLDRMRVERINTPEQYQELLDKHRETHSPTGRPLFPTHMIRMEGEVVGSLCLSSPTVHMSMDKSKMKVRDSLLMLNIMDSLMIENGIKNYLFACEETSPYHQILDKRLRKISGTDGCQEFHLFKREL